MRRNIYFGAAIVGFLSASSAPGWAACSWDLNGVGYPPECGYRGGGGGGGGDSDYGGNDGVNINGGFGDQSLLTLPFWFVLQGAKALTPDPQEAAREATRLNGAGNAAWSAGNYNEAQDLYERALQQAPNDSVIAENLSAARDKVLQQRASENAQFEAEQVREAALQQAEEAREGTQQEANRLNDEGVDAWEAGDYVTAQRKFAEAAQYAPNDPDIARYLGLAKTRVQTEAKARQGNALDTQALAAEAAGDHARAVTLLTKALQTVPGDPTITEHLRQAKAKLAATKSKQQLAQKNAATAANGSAGRSTGSGAFGTRGNPANPDLDRSPPPPSVFVRNTAEQLSSAAKSGSAAVAAKSGEAAKTLSGCAFDTETCAKPTALPVIDKESGRSPTAAALASRIPEAAMKDKAILDNLAFVQKLDGRKVDTESKIAAIQKEIEGGKGDTALLKAEKSTLTNQLQLTNIDQARAEDQIKKRVVNLGLSWNESPKPMTSALKTP